MVFPFIINNELRVDTSNHARPNEHEAGTSSVRGFGKHRSSKFGLRYRSRYRTEIDEFRNAVDNQTLGSKK